MTKKPAQLRIAYLTNISTNGTHAGGSVHVSQVAERLIRRGHRLYTNLRSEAGQFVKLTERGFCKRGGEIDVFYIRIHGSAANDELTLLRRTNAAAPCIWEVNAPLEESRTFGRSAAELQKAMRRRREMAGMVDAAICVSREMEEYARVALGIKRTFVIPNGSDTELFTPAKRDEKCYGTTKYKILWSGSPKYGWQGLRTVQAFAAKLKEEGIEDIMLFVTADGASSDNLVCLGHVPYNEMPRYMASADVGLCIYEPVEFYDKFYFSPLKLYDYMASAIPVIGTNEGQIRLVIQEHQNGLLTGNAVDDLVRKTLYLKNNPDTARAMGLRGRDAVLGKYNWEHIVSETEAVLAGLLVPAQSSRGLSRSAHSRYWKISMYIQIYCNVLANLRTRARNILRRAWRRLLHLRTVTDGINRGLDQG